ncbi:phospholipase D-like domain-containing protein [Mucilaginibacter endophyticus]|uniref:phospholipase D-like domain-containing protein n=1 Tax=Mucilaginibacter endophyticus TaxID=2675003 RepID=UPI000E0D8E65|nr:phospholipase D-like domain-containing protein [Mucilaginibacter endophyticus]
MATLSLKKPADIHIKVTACNNCDDVQLTWRTLDNMNTDSPVEGCLGFMIERQRKTKNKWGKTEILRNRVGFDSANVDPEKPESLSQPSSIWPFQRYGWTEHGANNNDSVRYRVSCLGKKANTVLGKTKLQVIAKSSWTAQIDVNAAAGDDIEVYFNRGAVMSQYVARIAREKKWTANDISNNVRLIQEPLRIFLSGELRIVLLKLLNTVIQDPFLDIHAALFELSDTELIDKLKQIGPRAHIVLSDGANTKTIDGHTAFVDENEDVRADLKLAGVNVSDRLLAKEGLGHNKILITVDNRTDKAVSAWTGSTNWSPTGLCTQLNNGILLKDAAVAGLYYDYWKKLKQAGSAFTSDLVTFNGNTPKTIGNVSAWFTRTEKAAKKTTPVDIKYLQNLVNNAKESILYVMFQPGGEPLTSIVKKAAQDGMYIRGVVSTVIASNRENFRLLDETKDMPYTTNLVQPEGVGNDFSFWVSEVTRNIFLSKIGFAITHAKIIVIDAFTDNPIVVTGSHNFSSSASQANDENFVVITGNKALAKHYAVACISTYAHYRWRAYLHDMEAAGKKPWSQLNSDPTWQSSYLQNARTLRELQEWC